MTKGKPFENNPQADDCNNPQQLLQLCFQHQILLVSVYRRNQSLDNPG